MGDTMGEVFGGGDEGGGMIQEGGMQGGDGNELPKEACNPC